MVMEIVSTTMRLNIIFQSVHIPGCQNILSDHLSGLQQVEQFRAKAPSADPEPTMVPIQLLPENVNLI